MATVLIGGAALGAVFGELLKAVLEAKNKALMFRSILDRIEGILQSIIPVIKEIEELNKALDCRNEETGKAIEVIKQGKTLILECSKLGWYQFYKRPQYTHKLSKLEESLELFCQFDLRVQQARDIKETLLLVREEKRRNGKIAAVHNLDGFVVSCAVPEAPISPVGLEVALAELKMELFKEEVSMVVLSAPPGCGKTTLAKLFCHDNQVEETFKDNIFFVIVSKNATMEGIVQRLFKHKGQDVGNLHSDEDMVHHLEQFFRNMEPNPILLVLDDVWSESKSLLEKFKFQMPGYKILVTSRSVFPKFGSTYKLQPLNYENSFTLFCNSAFLPDRSSDIPNESVVNKIVKGCKGFPLALKVVGSSLCGEPTEIWETRALEFSKVGSIFEHNELLKSLQRSLDTLDSKNMVKECFMDLCSFPEDQRIPVTALIDMWVELYGLDEDAYAVAKLHQLSNLNLVDLVVASRKDASGCYNQHFVMQHDLLRELAIHQSNLESVKQRKRVILEMSANNVPNWWMEQKQPSLSCCLLSWCTKEKQPSISCRLLSISTDEKFSSSWCMIKAPEVEVLVLNFRAKSYSLPGCIRKMQKLKVLIVMNYSFFPTELSNLLLLGSLSNLKRIRLEQVSIPSFGFTSIQLKNLQKITLVMCNIGQAFSNSTIPVPEALPNLVEISIDYCNDLVELPVGLCQLVQLKKLSITNCHKLVALHKEISRLVNLEVLRLKSCIELLELPDTIQSLHQLSILDITECLEITRLPEQIGDLHNLRELHMMGCSNNLELPPSILKLEALKKVICDEETVYLWEPFAPLLKNLHIEVHREDINLNWLYNHRF